MGDKPIPGMGNVSKAEGLYLQKTRAELIKWEERLNSRLEKNLVSERGLSFSLLHSVQKGDFSDPNIKKLLEKDYRIWWMADCIAWAILQEYHYCFDLDEREDLLSIDEKFLEAKEKFLIKLKERDPKQYFIEVPHVALLSCEIRDMLHKPRLKNRQIHDLMWKFSEAKIQRLSPTFKSKDNKYIFQAGEFVDVVCGEIKFIKTERIVRRTQEPEWGYLIIFNKKNYLDFFYSVRLGFFDFRSPRFYSMSPGAQQILRFIGWIQRPSYLTLDQLCQIAQIKIKHVTKRRNTIERYLNELSQAKYIRGWHKDNKGVYAIFKTPAKNLPKG